MRGMASRLTVVTWNINSLRLRQAHLPTIIAALAPDIICLQETKVPDDLFPANLAAATGFQHIGDARHERL